jgi:5'-nucleotidase
VRILVTNDDGVDSEGLQVLARAMTRHGDVTVIAPDVEYSGAGASLGVLNRIRPEVHRVEIDGVPTAWALTGPPALCVMFASLGVFGPPFDLVVSGINPGINVGRSIYHSGTVGAALTARARGISGVAVSQSVHGYGVEGQGWDEMLSDQRWEGAADVASVVVGALASEPPRAPVVVNLNVPNLPVREMAGWQPSSIGRIPPRVIAEAGLEPRLGHPGTFKVRMKWGDAVSLPAATDGGAVERDLVSITLLTQLAGIDGQTDITADEATFEQIAPALDHLFKSQPPTG